MQYNKSIQKIISSNYTNACNSLFQVIFKDEKYQTTPRIALK